MIFSCCLTVIEKNLFPTIKDGRVHRQQLNKIETPHKGPKHHTNYAWCLIRKEILSPFLLSNCP